MRIKDLGSRPAPALLLRLFRELQRGHAPATVVQRRQIPYWQERGWTQNANRYEGSYRTPFGSFYGTIEQERSGHIHFFLYNPSPEIRQHSHWTCFQDRGDGWYLVHMAREPRDVSSGIITIERLIMEAYRR